MPDPRRGCGGQIVWKVVPIMDKDGKVQIEESPLAQYGIGVTQVARIPTPL